MNKEEKRNSIKAFTMIEAIVVAVIVAILASIAIPVLGGYLRSSRLDSGRACIEMVGAAVMQTHNRGIDIGADDWGALGITNPSDQTWEYHFDPLPPNTDPPGYKLTARCLKGSDNGKDGFYYPNAEPATRWGGIF